MPGLEKVVLIVDDDKNVLSAIKRCLRNVNAQIHYFEKPVDALLFASHKRPDVVISDQRMPGMLGTELLEKIKLQYNDLQCILLSAFNDFDEVASAFNEHIIDKYLSKPWNNKELQLLIGEALLSLDQSTSFSECDERGSNFHGMLSEDQSMRRTFERIKKASTANIPIFISGETGTGKELAAKACHAESCRREEVFIAVNCANFSESLMESQLFGHTKGAFTGAIRSQQGLLSAAGNGTLFLDEITCLPLSLQAKLLRVIQEREFCSIGSYKPLKFHAQVISASSTPLREAVTRGEFREDLFYRLDVISIEMPRLKNRGSDILLLSQFFLAKFCESTGKLFTGFSVNAQKVLLDYDWPGNIRQLENLIHSVVVLNEGQVITQGMLAFGLPCENKKIATAQPPIDFVDLKSTIRPLWLIEKKTIESAIATFNGNVPRAAAALEVSPSTLYRKIQHWKTGISHVC